MNTCVINVNTHLRWFNHLPIQPLSSALNAKEAFVRFITMFESFLRVVDFIKLIQDLPRLVKLRVSQKPKLKLNLRIKQVNLTKSGAEAFQL